jgi:hypothetical protein
VNHLKEYRAVILIIFAIFGILLAGAYFSPTFTEEKHFLELFILFGSLLFVFSALVVAAVLGFTSFALYMALFVSAVTVMYGIEGTLLVIVMTYLAWGLAFSIQLLLVDNGVENAVEWFSQRYNIKHFRQEYYLFLPMTYLLYLLIEIVPNLLHGEKVSYFSPKEAYQKIEDVLSKK